MKVASEKQQPVESVGYAILPGHDGPVPIYVSGLNWTSTATTTTASVAVLSSYVKTLPPTPALHPEHEIHVDPIGAIWVGLAYACVYSLARVAVEQWWNKRPMVKF